MSSVSLGKDLDNSRKVESKYDNPIDNIFVHISDSLCPFFKSIGYTPSGLTTLSLIFGAAALYHMAKKEVGMFSVYAVLAYLFDIMSGQFSRKYDAGTASSDRYACFKNLIIVVITVYLMYAKYNVTVFPVVIIVLIALFVLASMYTGCQESMSRHKSDSLMSVDFLTPSRQTCSKHVDWLRFFGVGTLVVAVIASLWYLDSNYRVSSNDVYLDISGQGQHYPMIGYHNTGMVGYDPGYGYDYSVIYR